MRAAIFNPYLDTLGGGERYTMAVAALLLEKGYLVDIEWKDEGILPALENRFGIKLKGIRVVNGINRGEGYDLCFWVSDGSIPMFHSRKNILHFQLPFTNVGGDSLINRMKMIRVNKVVCNSQFTKHFIDREFKINSVVVYPPVPVRQIKPKSKENIIFSVGRFSQLTQAKHQDILVEAFRKLYDNGITDWRLVLAGGSEIGAKEYLTKLRDLSQDYPVTIMESPTFSAIRDLYGISKIYWSASGFGVDDVNEPRKVEHFGIAVVEAMAAGCLPIIYGAGGHKETVREGINGFLWKDVNELILKTSECISNKTQWKKITGQAKKDCQQFSYEEFDKAFSSII